MLKIVVLWLFPLMIWANNAPLGVIKLPPSKVFVGAYINQISNINLKTNNFDVDMYLWFRWDDPKLTPDKTFWIVGGNITSNRVSTVKLLPNGVHYVCLHVVATIKHSWNVTHFPLNDNTLKISIEDEFSTAKELEYVPDVESSGFSELRDAEGFNLQKFFIQRYDYTYGTNYGDPSPFMEPKSDFSRVSFNVFIPGGGLNDFFKTYWNLFLSFLVGFMAVLTKPEQLDQRFALAIGAIFATSASAIVISGSLPPSSHFVLADKLNFLTILSILFIAFSSAIIVNLEEKQHLFIARWMNRWSFPFIFMFYFGTVIYLSFMDEIDWAELFF
ncbi:MAG: hypothetical protein WA080_06785 [Sulfuricurvum sp.]